jgi:hypothetical protein
MILMGFHILLSILKDETFMIL